MLNVILNESEIINNALEGKYESDKLMITINLLIKYYYINGMDDKLKLREQILNFLKNNYKQYKRAKWEDTITKSVDKFLTTVRKNKIAVKIFDIDEIKITKSELQKIKELNNIKLEKIAFVMLVYAKISNIMMNSDEGWINKSCSIICKEAKVNLKGTEKEKIFNELYVKGYIEQRKHNAKTNMKVSYIDNESEIALVINDFENVVYYYILWKDNSMIRCEVCKKPIKANSNKTKYCKECAKEVKLEQTREIARESMRKIRKNQDVKKIEKVTQTIDTTSLEPLQK